VRREKQSFRRRVNSKRRKPLFEKSGTKNFCESGPRAAKSPWSNLTKVFCRAFFQKSAFSLP
jgi:hypothetical protein